MKCELCKNYQAVLKHTQIIRNSRTQDDPEWLVMDLCRKCFRKKNASTSEKMMDKAEDKMRRFNVAKKRKKRKPKTPPAE